MKNYYLGLDIGTDSVGHAATDEEYNLLKYHGEPAWGVMIFDEAETAAERRSHRIARRRTERVKQRIDLIREMFAEPISAVDPRFFIRIDESKLYREDVDDRYILFNDPDYTDKDYFKEYPTIHHLINDLMENKEPHDVRQIYLACSWLVSHRGHFLSNINVDNLDEIKDFSSVWDSFQNFFISNEFDVPWDGSNAEEISRILRKKEGVTGKRSELVGILFKGEKPSKIVTEEFPFSAEAIVKLLSGGTCKVEDLLCNEAYKDSGSITLGMDDSKYEELMAELGDDFEVLGYLRAIYDWTLLVDILGNGEGGDATISRSMVQKYEQHKRELAYLKSFVRKYLPGEYKKVFRSVEGDLYSAYAYHTDKNTEKLKKTKKAEFSKELLKLVEKAKPEPEDVPQWEDMKERLKFNTFLPKQKDTDNRVIPHQLYEYELKKILENAEAYLPFLAETDESGLSVSQKIMSVFRFRIPYYVGPLNSRSTYGWIKRKAGRIYPWNFDEMVDLDASEQAFIKKLTNTCTYLPGETVLPKDSLLYHKFTVLNEINNLSVNGMRISVELKQSIYNDLFLNKKKITRKRLLEYLISNGVIGKGEEETVKGIDEEIKSNLIPQIAFSRLISERKLTENDVERIIERSSYAEDKARLSKWISREYPGITEEDKRYICSLRLKDFGRLSAKFLCGIEGCCVETGEVMTIIDALWNTSFNLMELLSSKFTFTEEIENFRKEYYAENPTKLEDRLKEMYISPAVKRSVYRTLDIVKDYKKAFGEPHKIFIEVTRGADPDKKGKRTSSRKQQLLDLYKQCKDQDVRLLEQQIEDMGIAAENRLQSDKLFLYYLQLGKCVYTGEAIPLEKLVTKEYDIDHIYPQSKVKDDSIINNRVLVTSRSNGEKGDKYPVDAAIRNSMKGFWKKLKEIGLMSEEKYSRLVRSTPFTDEEKMGFINRQLTETSQASTAVATLLKEHFPNAEIIYSRARIVSDFRQDFELPKSRLYNDLHHAADAYLNIVTGNVYHMKFTRKWFNIDSQYSIKTKTVFSQPLVCGGQTVWGGSAMLAKVQKIASRNNAHFTRYSYLKSGKLFDQTIEHPSQDLIPLKKALPAEKYGGYNSAAVQFFIPVKYRAGKKTDIMITSVELMHGKEFLADESYAVAYAKNRVEKILGKQVEDVSFPLGLRPLKVNTMLSLDGFRVCITGGSNKGKCLIAQSMVPFASDNFWKFYLKKLEMFVEKTSKNENFVYDEKHDKVSVEKNLELYKLYFDKVKKSIYSKRLNAPVRILEDGYEKFITLDIINQAKVLLTIHQVFGRQAGGCDLTLIGGAKGSATTNGLSSNISNWKKNYHDARIIDISPSGIWEKKSVNLLELI